MCDIVVATEHYGTVRIPRYVCDALLRWAESDEFPKGAPMWIEDGELFVDLRPPGKRRLRTYWTDQQHRKRKKLSEPEA